MRGASAARQGMLAYSLRIKARSEENGRVGSGAIRKTTDRSWRPQRRGGSFGTSGCRARSRRAPSCARRTPSGTSGNDRDNRAVVRAVPTGELDLVGPAVYGLRGRWTRRSGGRGCIRERVAGGRVACQAECGR